MQTVFDVKEFGAVGDGTSDDTLPIQRALDSAGECHGEVIVPPGVYCVRSLKIRGKAVTVRGSGSRSYREAAGSILSASDASAKALIDISDATGVLIEGLTLEGNNLGNRMCGILLYHEKYNGGGEEDTAALDNCKVGHFSGDGVRFEHVWCFSVRHSMLHRNGGAGLFIDGWDGFLTDNWFSGNSGGGLRGGAIAASCTCTGNRVEWNHMGGFVLPNANDFNITGNYFDRSFGPALSLGSKKDKFLTAAITGNEFYRSGAFSVGEKPLPEEESVHVRIENGMGIVLSGNTFRAGRDDGGVGNLTPMRAIMLKNCRACVVSGNAGVGTHTGDEAITAEQCEDCVIADNRLFPTDRK